MRKMSDEERNARLRLAEILGQPHDEASCRQCLAALDDYVDDVLNRGDGAPETAVHLDACTSCAGAFARLYELRRAEAAGTLPATAPSVAPDFSFLVPNAATPLTPGQARRRLWIDAVKEQLTEGVRRVGERVALALSPDLQALLAPVASAAVARSAADRFGEPLLELTPELAGAVDIPFGLNVYADAQAPANCLVEVSVQAAGKTWPDLAGYEVVIAYAPEDRRVLRSDAWGVAAFLDVPLAALHTFEVTVTPP